MFKLVYESRNSALCSVPSVISDKFLNNNQLHCYNTRNSNMLHLSRDNSSSIFSSSIFYACRLWNSLPDKLKNTSSIFQFRKLLKERFILSQRMISN